jgi:predicted transcriptional regulator
MTKQAPSALYRAIAATIRAEEAVQNLMRGELSKRSGIPVRSLHTYLTEGEDQREMTIGQIEAVAKALGFDGAIHLARVAAEQRL